MSSLFGEKSLLYKAATTSSLTSTATQLALLDYLYIESIRWLVRSLEESATLNLVIKERLCCVKKTGRCLKLWCGTEQSSPLCLYILWLFDSCE